MKNKGNSEEKDDRILLTDTTWYKSDMEIKFKTNLWKVDVTIAQVKATLKTYINKNKINLTPAMLLNK